MKVLQNNVAGLRRVGILIVRSSRRRMEDEYTLLYYESNSTTAAGEADPVCVVKRDHENEEMISHGQLQLRCWHFRSNLFHRSYHFANSLCQIPLFLSCPPSSSRSLGPRVALLVVLIVTRRAPLKDKRRKRAALSLFEKASLTSYSSFSACAVMLCAECVCRTCSCQCPILNQKNA
jgi:hypothetical protein